MTDYLRDDERFLQQLCDGSQEVDMTDVRKVHVSEIIDRLAETRRVLEKYAKSHAENTPCVRIKNGKIERVNACGCNICEEAAAALEGVER